mgnify:CR=1 FL=1
MRADDAQRQELDNRLMIIDWVRDTINAPAEELGPSQLAQRAVDLICNVAGDRVTYRITKGEDLREQGYMGLHTVGRVQNVLRYCWRWITTQLAIKKRQCTRAWLVKASLLIPAATASNRPRLWTR